MMNLRLLGDARGVPAREWRVWQAWSEVRSRDTDYSVAIDRECVCNCGAASQPSSYTSLVKSQEETVAMTTFRRTLGAVLLAVLVPCV
jgi:hypothetical protein